MLLVLHGQDAHRATTSSRTRPRASRSGEADALAGLRAQKELAVEMKNALLRRRLRDFGELLHTAWEAKKRMSGADLERRIDELYDEARARGRARRQGHRRGRRRLHAALLPLDRKHRVAAADDRARRDGRRVRVRAERRCAPGGSMTTETAPTPSAIRESARGRRSSCSTPAMLEAIDRCGRAASRTRCAPAASCSLFGNGGSAADATHIAAEFVGRFLLERRALPALSLSDNASAVTAIGNDYGYEQVFARQVEALGRARRRRARDLHERHARPTCSRASRAARDGGPGDDRPHRRRRRDAARRCATSASWCRRDETPRIQEAHTLVAHIAVRAGRAAIVA